MYKRQPIKSSWFRWWSGMIPLRGLLFGLWYIVTDPGIIPSHNMLEKLIAILWYHSKNFKEWALCFLVSHLPAFLVPIMHKSSEASQLHNIVNDRSWYVKKWQVQLINSEHLFSQIQLSTFLIKISVMTVGCPDPVSYTHLDVYKRQHLLIQLILALYVCRQN